MSTMAEAVDAAERGRLSIDRHVLRKIAEYAADQAPGGVRTQRRSGFGTQGASARLSGPDQELRIHLELTVRYPDSVPRTITSVRERVIEDLQRIAGCRVRAVDVTVSGLVPERPSRRVE